MDCALGSGCNGGLEHYTWIYSIENKTSSNEDYPYTATDGTCKYPANKVSWAESYARGISPATAETRIMNNGPITLAVRAYNDSFRFY